MVDGTWSVVEKYIQKVAIVLMHMMAYRVVVLDLAVVVSLWYYQIQLQVDRLRVFLEDQMEIIMLVVLQVLELQQGVLYNGEIFYT